MNILAAGLVERWRDIGPVLWLGAAAALGIWIVLLLVFAATTEPRRVKPGPETFEPPGSTAHAVVNLITSDWELGREAVSATLLDLGARGYVSVDWIGERTLVRVRQHGPTASGLTAYEQMVLEHVHGLSKQTADGFVPAEALTTGPESTAKNWWHRFEREVTTDARRLGLSRPRWGAQAKSLLSAMAVVVGLAVAIAASTLPSTGDNDDDPVGAAIAFGVMSAGILLVVSNKLGGERDTPAGRAAASQWLGLKQSLEHSASFAEQPAGAVVIWERMLGYGAAMGVARNAVADLPLGAESDHEAWSPVGDRWRVVRIRYPDHVPPGYGRHPALAAFIGVLLVGLGVVLAPMLFSLANALTDAIADFSSDRSVPAWVDLAIGIALAVFTVVGVLLFVTGAAMVVAGLGDLVRGRRQVEGRVLRIRERVKDKKSYWHVAIDDGSADRVRAWRVAKAPPLSQGDQARASVSRWLGYVAALEPVRSGAERQPSVPAAPAAAAPPLPAPGAVATALGIAIAEDPEVPALPLAHSGAARAYLAQDGAQIVLAWLPAQLLREGEQRVPHGRLRRIGPHVLLAMVHAPSWTPDQQERAIAALSDRASIAVTGATT